MSEHTSRCRRRGLTILEVLVATAIITLGLLALIATVPGMINLTRTSRESQIAYSAARSQIDQMRAMPFPDPSNPSAPNLLNTYSGATFTAQGLTPPPSGPQGRVVFMSEQEASTAFGITLDLDLDARNNESEAANDAFIAYPVRVEVRWRDESAFVRSVTLTSMVYSSLR